ncbi:MAG: hypothetical protein AB8C02_12780 [Halioglobus sp.]
MLKPLTAALVESVTGELVNGHTNLGNAIEQLVLPAGVYSSDVTRPFGDVDVIDDVVRDCYGRVWNEVNPICRR